jgi:DNA polymerase III delta prime subunit
MQAVIGQEKIVKLLESYTLQTAPKTMLFLGQKGCGKHWIATRFAEQLNLDCVNVEASSADELRNKLIEIYQCPVDKFYIFNLDGMSPTRQNVLLKFIEEPTSTMHIILTAESETNILETVVNRCVKYVFEEYTSEQLKEFSWAIDCNDQRVYEICKTPGQLNNLPSDNLDAIFAICENIVNHVQNAGYANTLSLLTKVNLKDDSNKIDFNLFFEVLKYVAFENYKKTGNDISFKIYLYTIRKQSEAYGKILAKESFMLNYLDGLWRLTH